MSTKKRGLGKGLDALIIDDSLESNVGFTEKSNEANGLTYLKITSIEPNRSQPRQYFDEDALQELADSIKQYGVLQPIVVIKKENYYEIIAGERRWRASKIAGLKEVPVIVKEYSDAEVLEVSLIENIQRENLNAIEEAIAYKRLFTEFMLKQDEIADKVSKSRSAIANTMRLLNLDGRVQQMIIDEMITNGHARALLTIENSQMQFEIAQKIFDEKLSVRETEKLIKNIGKPQKKKKENLNIYEPILKELEKTIEEKLGTKVTINKKSDSKGTIEIDYYSNDELDRISDILRNVN